MTDAGVAETEQEEADAEDEADAGVEREVEPEEDTRGSASDDPVGAYLRMMTSFSLLTREGEIEIAKRIEDGKRRVLEVVLESPVAIDEILSLGNALRKAELRVTDVVGDVDTDDPDFDEQWHADRVCKVFETVRRLRQEREKRAASHTVRSQMVDALLGLRLHKRHVDRIVLNLKELLGHLEHAHSEIAACENRSALSAKDFGRALREMRSSPLRQRAVIQRLGLRPDEIEQMSGIISRARKKIRTVEREAQLTGNTLRATVHEIEEGERAAEQGKVAL